MEWKFSDFGYDKFLACFHGKLGVKKLTSYRLVGEEDNKNTTTITKYKLKLETCTQQKLLTKTTDIPQLVRDKKNRKQIKIF